MQTNLPMSLAEMPIALPVFDSHYRATEAEENALGALSIVPPNQRSEVLKLPHGLRKKALSELKRRFNKRLYMRDYMRKYPRSRP